MNNISPIFSKDKMSDSRRTSHAKRKASSERRLGNKRPRWSVPGLDSDSEEEQSPEQPEADSRLTQPSRECAKEALDSQRKDEGKEDLATGIRNPKIVAEAGERDSSSVESSDDDERSVDGDDADLDTDSDSDTGTDIELDEDIIQKMKQQLPPRSHSQRTNEAQLITREEPWVLDDPDAELSDGKESSVSFAWDGKKSTHKRYNNLDLASREIRRQTAKQIQGAWPGIDPLEWIPEELLPDGHPVHPLNMSGTIHQWLVDLAKATKGNVELAHFFLRVAPTYRKDNLGNKGKEGDKIGDKDIKRAWRICERHKAELEFRAQFVQQQQEKSDDGGADDQQQRNIDETTAPAKEASKPESPAEQSPASEAESSTGEETTPSGTDIAPSSNGTSSADDQTKDVAKGIKDLQIDQKENEKNDGAPSDTKPDLPSEAQVDQDGAKVHLEDHQGLAAHPLIFLPDAQIWKWKWNRKLDPQTGNIVEETAEYFRREDEGET